MCAEDSSATNLSPSVLRQPPNHGSYLFPSMIPPAAIKGILPFLQPQEQDKK